MQQQTKHSPFHRYLQRLSLWTAVALLTTVGLNILIDPYGLYQSPRIKGLNAVKTEVSSHQRLIKATGVETFKPGAIVLGTSRAMVGIDPYHPGWGAAPVYNLALPGCNVYEAFRYLQHTQAIQPLQQVVLMVDFFMFNAVAFPDTPDFDESIFTVDVEGKLQARGVGAKINILFSLDILFASLRTVKNQANDRLAIYLANGMEEPPHEAINIDGLRKQFLSNENGYFNTNYDQFSFKIIQRDNWQIYQQLLKLAHQQGIVLHIAISPFHARLSETIAAKGIWGLFEQWKQQLAALNESVAVAQDKPPFPLWDFSGYNHYTTETVPALGDRETTMQWYWESSHYKKELGDLVLDRIFGYDHPGRLISDDFGVLFTPESINAHLQQIREDRERWRVSFPEDAAEIDALKGAGGMK
jgi:hypothetical protein